MLGATVPSLMWHRNMAVVRICVLQTHAYTATVSYENTHVHVRQSDTVYVLLLTVLCVFRCTGLIMCDGDFLILGLFSTAQNFATRVTCAQSIEFA